MGEPGAEVLHQLELAHAREAHAPLNDPRERRPLDVGHREERQSVVLAVIGDADDVVVAKVGDRVGFVLEELAEPRARPGVLRAGGVAHKLVEKRQDGLGGDVAASVGLLLNVGVEDVGALAGPQRLIEQPLGRLDRERAVACLVPNRPLKLGPAFSVLPVRLRRL